MDKWADLHIHTYYSDSTSSPQEVVDQALAKGLSCIAVTDHDIIEGIEPAMEAAKGKALEIIPGVELSAEINGQDVHILGYLFDIHNKRFIETLEKMQRERIVRMKKMIVKLKELDVADIDYDEVAALTKSNAVGRPHLAQILRKQKKVKSLREAFNKYLADEAPAFVPKLKITPKEAIKLIRNAGGVAVLAHPMMTKVDELISKFKDEGLQGLEVYYPNCSPAIIRFYENLAKKYKMVATGGSDAHGEAKKNTYVGKAKIPYSLVEDLKALV